jgi:thiol-disulfide isomerase/thioredoxin
MGEKNIESVTRWIEKITAPVVRKFNVSELKTIKNNSDKINIIWVVKYHKPNCSVCEFISSHYQKIAESYSDNTTIIFGEINCEENKEYCDQDGINQFPTIMIYYRGVILKNHEFSNENSLNSWITLSFSNLKAPIQSLYFFF